MKYRSVLFVPGHEEKKIKKAYSLNADLIVIDLESTVPNDEKENAKKIIRSCNVDKNKTYIRINDNSDLNFVTSENFPGIFLPFTESEEQLKEIENILKKNENLKTNIIPICAFSSVYLHAFSNKFATISAINLYLELISLIDQLGHSID